MCCAGKGIVDVVKFSVKHVFLEGVSSVRTFSRQEVKLDFSEMRKHNFHSSCSVTVAMASGRI